jgi:hypothetical protein
MCSVSLRIASSSCFLQPNNYPFNYPLEPKASRTWEHLEDFVREHAQQFIQALLEEEVTELLGRTKSARREAVDGIPRTPKAQPRLAA